MRLIVYHGSDKVIDNPKHDGGRRYSDFGKGFYVTTNVKMAKSWATRKSDRPSVVNKYIFEVEGLNDELRGEDIDV